MCFHILFRLFPHLAGWNVPSLNVDYSSLTHRESSNDLIDKTHKQHISRVDIGTNSADWSFNYKISSLFFLGLHFAAPPHSFWTIEWHKKHEDCFQNQFRQFARCLPTKQRTGGDLEWRQILKCMCDGFLRYSDQRLSMIGVFDWTIWARFLLPLMLDSISRNVFFGKSLWFKERMRTFVAFSFIYSTKQRSLEIVQIHNVLIQIHV